MARRWMLASLLLFVALGWAVACRTAPVTGRKQMLLVPETQEVSLGASAFQEVVTKEPPSKNQQYIDMVTRVGQRIAAVAGKPDYQWEFRVVATGQQNAFCLPGGKVVVHDGIIPICQNEAGLAVVMSHEIAHALARHGGERMTQSYAVDGVKQAVSYVTQQMDQQKQEMVMKAYGAGSQYGFILPYSRAHESEADHIGLMLMSKAGYDPTEAPRFWQRFAAAHTGNQPTEFFSTHPSDDHRASALSALLPEAQKLYDQAPQKYGLGDPIAPAPPSATAATPAPAAGSLSAQPAGATGILGTPTLPASAVAPGAAGATGASANTAPPPFATPQIFAPRTP